MKIIVAVLALATATLVGCGGSPVRVQGNQAPQGMSSPPPRGVQQQPVSATPAAPPSKPAAVAVASAKPAAAVVQATSPVQPSLLKSLQPFKTFAKGTGHGMARLYKDRDKAAFVAMMKGPKQMRVSCERLVQQMVEIHNLPFENCEGAAAEILRNSDYAVIACRDEMFQRDNQLTITNDDGSAFNAWHRKCLAGERVLVYKNQPIASTMCGNVTIPVVAPAPAPAPKPGATPVATEMCPNGRILMARAYAEKDLPAHLFQQEQGLINAAKNQQSIKKAADGQTVKDPSAYRGDRLSRTMGRDLYNQVPPSGNFEIHLHLLDSKTLLVSEDLGIMRLVGGVSTRPLTDAQIAKIARTTWPSNFKSPVGSEGQQEIWMFGTDSGDANEWGKECTMVVSATY